MNTGSTPGARRLFIVGAGGHAREVAWLAREVLGEGVAVTHVVDRPEFITPHPGRVTPRLIADIGSGKGADYLVAIGDVSARRRLARQMDAAGFRAVTLVHPGIRLSPNVAIGAGAVIAVGSVLTTDIVLGAHVHVNVACAISHDVDVGEFSTLAPGAKVAGHVRIGRDVFVGAGATIINGQPDRPLVVGDGAVIAAGACVIEHVAPGSMVAGVPATRRR